MEIPHHLQTCSGSSKPFWPLGNVEPGTWQRALSSFPKASKKIAKLRKGLYIQSITEAGNPTSLCTSSWNDFWWSGQESSSSLTCNMRTNALLSIPETQVVFQARKNAQINWCSCNYLPVKIGAQRLQQTDGSLMEPQHLQTLQAVYTVVAATFSLPIVSSPEW